MARGESQGLQVAVILFTLLTVGLSISTYMFYTSAEAEKKKTLEALTAKKNAEDGTRKELYKVQAMRLVLGLPNVTLPDVEAAKGAGDTEIDKLIEDWKKDSTIYTQAVADGANNYLMYPKTLLTASTERNKEIGEAKESLNARTKDVETLKADTDKKIEATNTNLTNVQADYDKEKEQFKTDRAEFVKKQDDIASQLKVKDDLIKKQKETADKAVFELNDRIAILERELKEVREENKRIVGAGPDFEQPDGEITWVNQRQRMAWIDLGFEDGLQRQTTFTVYEHDENGVSTGKKKGSLEVIRLLEPHLAECRILTDEIKDPLLPGDKIFTPGWSPGQRFHFAIAGFVDLDKDGRSDRERLKNIIALNGGVIDAELTDGGKRTGRLTPQTRYLIVGSRPDERNATEGEGNVLTQFSTFYDEARSKGVDVIDVAKYLDQAGWKAQEKTDSLGRAAVGEGRDPKKQPGKAGAAPKAKSEAPAEAPPAKKPAAADDDPFAAP